MRFRAARVSLAFVLAAAMAVAGAAGSHAGARFLNRATVGVAASPAHVVAAGLSGLHAHHAHDRATAADAVFGPAALVALLLVAAVVLQRRRSPAHFAPSPAQARGPPAAR